MILRHDRGNGPGRGGGGQSLSLGVIRKDLLLILSHSSAYVVQAKIR